MEEEKPDWSISVATSSPLDMVHGNPVNDRYGTDFKAWRKHPKGWKAGIKDALVHYFPQYRLVTSGPVNIDERPDLIRLVFYGFQHVLAMFSSTIVIPIAMGMDPSTSLFFSGIGTIIFFICTGGRVPSFLGSSGSLISAMISVTGYDPLTAPNGLNPNIPIAQGGLVILSLIYILVSVICMVFGSGWIELLMPPVVTGTIITSIGLHLGYGALARATVTSFDTYMGLATAFAIMLISIYGPWPSIRRIAILLGLAFGFVIHIVCGVCGVGYPIDFSEVTSTPWVRGPIISGPPVFESQAISTIAPLVVVLLAENMGHLKAIGSLTDKPIDRYIGRSYLGDALAILLAACVGSSPQTTYAENIGVLSITRIFSPLVILFGAGVVIVLSIIAKLGAVLRSIPNGVIGTTSIILYSLIAITGVRIWVVNKVDFNDTRNVFVAGIPLMLAAAMTTTMLQINSFQLDGIGCATFAAIILYQVLRGYDGFRGYYLCIKSKIHCRRQRPVPVTEAADDSL